MDVVVVIGSPVPTVDVGRPPAAIVVAVVVVAPANVVVDAKVVVVDAVVVTAVAVGFDGL
jgi:hypothetical protein